MSSPTTTPPPAAPATTDPETAPPTTTETPVPAAPARRSRPAGGRRRGPRLFSGDDQATTPPAGPESGPGDVDEPPGSGTGPGEPGSSRPDSEDPSTRSGRARGASPFRKGELKKAIEATVVGTSILAHDNLARDELDQLNEVYVVTDAEAEGLAEPLAGIASRRMRAGDAGNPDVIDVIRALVTVAAYVTRQLRLRAEIRKARRGHVDPPAEVDPPAGVDQGAAQP